MDIQQNLGDNHEKKKNHFDGWVTKVKHNQVFIPQNNNKTKKGFLPNDHFK